MRKIINSLFLGTFIISGASAKDAPVLTVNGSMGVIPGSVSYADNPQIIIEDEDGYNVYDGDLQKINTLPDLSRTYTADTCQIKTIHMEENRSSPYVYTFDNLVKMSNEEDAFEAASKDREVLETLRYEDRTIFVYSWLKDSYRFTGEYATFRDVKFPEKYAKLVSSCKYLDKETNYLYDADYGNADIIISELGGSFGIYPHDYYGSPYYVQMDIPCDPEIIEGDLLANPQPCHHTDFQTGAESVFEWSQTLFDDDGEFEVIRPTFISNGIETTGVINHKDLDRYQGATFNFVHLQREIPLYICNGLEIVKASGDVIATLEVPDGFDINYYYRNIHTIKLPNSTLISVPAFKDGEKWIFVWSIDHKTTAVEQFQAPQRCFRVSQSGDNINVDGAQSPTVGLYTPSGALMRKASVSNGHATIGSVNPGMAIVSDGQNAEKIIIK